MNKSVFITIIFLCLQRSFAAIFSTNSFVTYQWETQLNSLAVEEFDINGTLLQKIALPSSYLAVNGDHKIRLDSKSTTLAAMAFESSSNSHICYTLNANGEKVDITSFKSSGSRDCIVEGQDVWMNYGSGIAYTTRGSTAVSVSGNSIVTGLSQIMSAQRVGTKLFLADAPGSFYGGDPIVTSGTMTMTSILTNVAAFYVHNQNTLYVASLQRPISRYTLNAAGTTATLVWTWTPSVLTNIPRSVLAMDVGGKTYVFVTYYDSSFNFFVQRFVDDGTTLTNQATITQPSQDQIHFLSLSPKPSCTDKLVNQDETDVDCGGTKCSKCTDDKKCLVNGDCNSGFCNSNKICKTPTCSDLAKNQDETDVDCGGSICSGCGFGKKCVVNADCSSKRCTGGTCNVSCLDGIKNQDETDIDCGGQICQTCNDNKLCLSGSDCTSSFCNPTTTKCATPTCLDSFKNQDETDVDCGGATCATRCAAGKHCSLDSDCSEGVCEAGTCVTCNDNIMNQDETDVDCGGVACTARCDIGNSCIDNSDCNSNNCASNVCAAAPVAVPVAIPVAPQAGPASPSASPVTTPVAAPVASPTAPQATPGTPLASPVTAPVDAPTATPEVPVALPVAEAPIAEPTNQSPQSNTSPESPTPDKVPSSSTPVVFQISSAVVLHFNSLGLIGVLIVQTFL